MTKDLTPSPHRLYDEECKVSISPVPKIFFSRSKDGTIEHERVTITDRHGVDITRLFDPIKYIGFEYYLRAGFAKAKLLFGTDGSDWNVDCGPDGFVNKMRVVNALGYDLMDGLEPNTLDQHYPCDGRPEIEITFDAEWGK